jgi:hypothetical protein
MTVNHREALCDIECASIEAAIQEPARTTASATPLDIAPVAASAAAPNGTTVPIAIATMPCALKRPCTRLGSMPEPAKALRPLSAASNVARSDTDVVSVTCQAFWFTGDILQHQLD